VYQENLVKNYVGINHLNNNLTMKDAGEHVKLLSFGNTLSDVGI